MDYDKTKYYEYLKSEDWLNIRKSVASRSNYTCERCGLLCRNKEKLYGFQIHHKNYKHIFDESNHLEDLRFLCNQCHQYITKKINKHLKYIEKINNEVLEDKKPQKIKFNCKKCNSNRYIVKKLVKNTGLYCKNCGRLSKFLKKKQISMYLNEQN